MHDRKVVIREVGILSKRPVGAVVVVGALRKLRVAQRELVGAVFVLCPLGETWNE